MTYWRDLPSLVVARDGDIVTKGPLAPRFQEAIDEAAMRLGETSSDAYLEGWVRGDWIRPRVTVPTCATASSPTWRRSGPPRA